MTADKRLLQLFTVLIYDSDTFVIQGKSYLTVGQRICINQERAYLMRELESDVAFQQSAIVDEKVVFILEQISQNNLSKAYAAHVRTQLENN